MMVVEALRRSRWRPFDLQGRHLVLLLLSVVRPSREDFFMFTGDIGLYVGVF